jgi:hypothetical protein
MIIADIDSINQLLTDKFNGLTRAQIRGVRMKGEFQETNLWWTNLIRIRHNYIFISHYYKNICLKL